MISTINYVDIESARQSLHEYGFAVIPDAVDPHALKTLANRVALFYRAWDRYPQSTRKEIMPPMAGATYVPVQEINWPEKALRLFDEERAFAEIRYIVDSLADTHCKLVHANSLLKPAVRGAPVPMHQDTAYNQQELNRPLTVWVPFAPVNRLDGALYYLRGSHRLGEFEHASAGGVRWIDEPWLREHGPFDRHDFSGELGSIGIHDSRLVHGSYPNQSPRDRLALSLRFVASK